MTGLRRAAKAMSIAKKSECQHFSLEVKAIKYI